MLSFSKRQAQAPLLFDRQALIEDIEAYLIEVQPEAMAALPRGLRWAVINETIRLCAFFAIYDVEHMRFFARMRWEMAPGFYREPRLRRVLADRARTEAERLDALAAPDMEDAWQAAIAGSDPAHFLDRAEDLGA